MFGLVFVDGVFVEFLIMRLIIWLFCVMIGLLLLFGCVIVE